MQVTSVATQSPVRSSAPARPKTATPNNPDQVTLGARQEPSGLKRFQAATVGAVRGGLYGASGGVLVLVGSGLGTAAGVGPVVGGVAGLAVSMVATAAIAEGSKARAHDVTADLIQGGLTAAFGPWVPGICGTIGAVLGACRAVKALESTTTSPQAQPEPRA